MSAKAAWRQWPAVVVAAVAAIEMAKYRLSAGKKMTQLA